MDEYRKNPKRPSRGKSKVFDHQIHQLKTLATHVILGLRVSATSRAPLSKRVFVLDFAKRLGFRATVCAQAWSHDHEIFSHLGVAWYNTCRTPKLATLDICVCCASRVFSRARVQLLGVVASCAYNYRIWCK